MLHEMDGHVETIHVSDRIWPMRTARFLGVGAGLAVAVLLLAMSVGCQGGRRVDLMLSGGTIVTMDASGRVIPEGAIAIDADRIVAVGTSQELAGQFAPRRRIDATGQIVLPGLINTHTHAPMVLYRGLADDL